MINPEITARASLPEITHLVWVQIRAIKSLEILDRHKGDNAGFEVGPLDTRRLLVDPRGGDRNPAVYVIVGCVHSNEVAAKLAAELPVWVWARLADMSNVGVWIDEVRGQWTQFALEAGGEVLL
jgi:hypothetical protein